jgi:hypothetical protein
MKIDDAERYRTTEMNRDLYLVHHGADLVGQVRRGMDKRWYPELPGEAYKMAALQKVVLANEAIDEYRREADGRTA